MSGGQRPIVAVSAGDPAGIGPEVTAKALAQERIYGRLRPLVVCDLGVMKAAIRFSGLELGAHAVESPPAGRYRHGSIDVLDMRNVGISRLRYGVVSAAAGRASFECVRRVIELALAGEVAATVTGPISKAAIHAAGFRYAGHTEIFGALTGCSDHAMMLVDGPFRVVHVSTHCSLREACDRVRTPRVLRVIQLADQALRQLGVNTPRIGVAGLNPHAGEAGLFGLEEAEQIEPAVRAARALAMDVSGPFPADTLFPRMAGGSYDAVVAMYHDQGHIPTKLRGFRYESGTDSWPAVAGVNVTLGLPIVRTSVDHGTAFDRAGRGTANPESMIQALEMAACLAGATAARPCRPAGEAP